MRLHANLHHYISSRVLINVSAHVALGRFFDRFFCVVDIDTSFCILRAVKEPDTELTDFLKLFLPDTMSFDKDKIERIYTNAWIEILAWLVCKFLMILYCMAAYIGSSISPAM